MHLTFYKLKLLFLLACCWFSIEATAQSREVTGTVLSGTGNQPVIGATILVKNTTNGTTTDTNGKFSINAPANSVLVVSFIGYNNKEVPIGNQTTLSIILEENTKALEEVVVTALGIKKDAKKLGYSTATVSTDNLTQSRTTNVGNSLVGKVAGLQVQAPPTGAGGSSKIRIRGQATFGANNSPLIIVNGIPVNNNASGGANGSGSGFAGEANTDRGDGLQSINPDDIESMTVLKGAAASALYGFRANNGVIIITTKSGKNQTGIGVDITSNFQADQALDYTDFQYEYGQGENGQRQQVLESASVLAARGAGRGTGQWSFGERFDGKPTIQFDGEMHPYSPNRDRVKDFFRTGTTLTNSVALSGGNEKGSFRMSFSNTDAQGLIPNSDFHKKILNLGITHNLTDKLSTQLNINYSNEYNHNPPVVAQQDFNINQTLYTLSNSIDVDWLKNYQYPNGNEIFSSRFTNRTNPYWTVNKRFEESRRDRIFGNASLRYQLTPWLYAQGRVGQDYFTNPLRANRPTGTGFLVPAAVGFNGDYFEQVNTFRELNLDFLVGANREFGNFGIDATFGGNSMDQKTTNIGTGVTNFFVRDLYTIGNGQTRNPNANRSQLRVNSLFGTVDLSFNNYLFLNLTGRNDWFSTLNLNNNNIFYPSVSSSFVFTQAFATMPNWLNYGKLRAAYAEVGGATDPYQNALFYSVGANPVTVGTNNYALGGVSGSVSPNANLCPSRTKELEAGIEFRVLDNRVNFDFSVYRRTTIDDILNVDISNASGFSQTKVNVGKLQNQGVEMLLSLTPVRTESFTWESALNGSYNISKVLELANGQTRFDTGTGEFIGTISHEVGQPLSSLRGFDYLRIDPNDPQSAILVNKGQFQQGKMVTYGSAVPKYTGGWLNTVTYKGIRLFAQVDFKAGHKLISNSNFNFYREGLHKASLEGRQDINNDGVQDGVIMDAVNTDGSPNTTAVAAQNFYSLYRGTSIATPFVYDASFVRWRTLSLGYDLSRFVSKTFIKGLNVNAYVNNVLMIKKYVDNLDPETQYSASDNLAGLEYHAMPTTRSYGLNLNIKL